MSAAAAHLAEARANCAFAQRLVDDPASDANTLRWAVTTAFYCAVHCIEAHLAGVDVHCENHGDRSIVMRSDGVEVSKRVRYAYNDLYTMSRQARYEIVEFAADYVRDKVLGDRLPRVTTLVGGL